MKKTTKTISILLALLMLASVFASMPFTVGAADSAKIPTGKSINATAKANWEKLRSLLKGNTINETIEESNPTKKTFYKFICEDNEISLYIKFKDWNDERTTELTINEVKDNIVKCIFKFYPFDEHDEDAKPNEVCFNIEDYGNSSVYDTDMYKFKEIWYKPFDIAAEKINDFLKEKTNISFSDLGLGVPLVDYNTIEEVVLQATPPKAGEKPSYSLTIPNNAGYKTEDINGYGWKNGVAWLNENGNVLYDDAVFEAGKKYRLRVSLVTASDNYRFANYAAKMKGYVNNKPAELDCFDEETAEKNILVFYTFTCNADPIGSCKISGIKAKTYNGKAQTQSVTVKDGSKTLKSNTDYTVSYKNNKNAGTATMTIKGKGNYKGSVNKTFKINKAANPMTVSYKKSVNAKADKKTTIKKAVTVTKAQGTVTYKTNNKKITVKKGTMTVAKGLKKNKTYAVKVTVNAEGNNNYNSLNKTVTIKVKVK